MKFNMWEICCNTDQMTLMCPTLQGHNLEKIVDLGFFSMIAQSPYAVSLSFLKDASLIGAADSEAKYNLNLDEAMISKFYQIIRDDPQTTHSTEDEDEPVEIKALVAIFCQSVRAFEEHIQFYLEDDIL